ncbi:MAG: geranylgeranyl diphosphate synthase, type [Thermovirga sp.]|nr:geranylgeranyl diphosphate synthase, type [Thermovirga sp.]
MRDNVLQKDFIEYYDNKKTVFEEHLGNISKKGLPNVPNTLWESMTYSLMAGGKRIRPVLTMTVGEVFGLREEEVLPLATAVEMIHTASLIHDDMPCMDNDTLRRGKPTNHVVYGEAMALLAGDALFLYAIEQAIRNLTAIGNLDKSNIMEAAKTLLEAAGPSGICSGQAMDMHEANNSFFSPWKIAYYKTATLIKAAVVSPAQLAGASSGDIKALTSYASHLGVAFQMVDDILDVIGEKNSLGKNPGKDEAQGKNTFIAVYGLEEAVKLARLHSQKSIGALSKIDKDTKYLASFAIYLESRTY